MKTAKQWISEYAESHQNKTNVTIHTVCVPLIYFSIVGMLMSIDNIFLVNLTGFKSKILINWATIVAIFISIFYLRLSFNIFLKMLLFTILCFLGNYYLSKILPLFYTSLTIFILVWIGQFYGHKLEGKKPSFFKDLQFLLIGPIWVFEKKYYK